MVVNLLGNSNLCEKLEPVMNSYICNFTNDKSRIKIESKFLVLGFPRLRTREAAAAAAAPRGFGRLERPGRDDVISLSQGDFFNY